MKKIISIDATNVPISALSNFCIEHDLEIRVFKDKVMIPILEITSK